jgi:hypothetical protein
MAVRTQGLLWALVASPVVGWTTVLSLSLMTHGRVGGKTDFLLITGLPAALAYRVNAGLGRDRGEVVRAALGAAFVGVLGIAAFALWFFLTVPPEFFE